MSPGNSIPVLNLLIITGQSLSLETYFSSMLTGKYSIILCIHDGISNVTKTILQLVKKFCCLKRCFIYLYPIYNFFKGAQLHHLMNRKKKYIISVFTYVIWFSKTTYSAKLWFYYYVYATMIILTIVHYGDVQPVELDFTCRTYFKVFSHMQ